MRIRNKKINLQVPLTEMYERLCRAEEYNKDPKHIFSGLFMLRNVKVNSMYYYKCKTFQQ